MNLYEMSEQIELLSEQMVDQVTGEINEEVLQQLEELEMDRDEKLENIGVLIKSIMAEVDALTTEKKSLEARIKVRTNKIERLMNYVNNCLKGEKKRYTKVEFGYHKSTKVIVVNEANVPDEYMKTNTTKTPMKKEIGAALKEGKRVPGCVLETNLNLQVK